jgi:hypothetical protein
MNILLKKGANPSSRDNVELAFAFFLSQSLSVLDAAVGQDCANVCHRERGSTNDPSTS